MASSFSGCTEQGPEVTDYFNGEYEAGDNTVLKVTSVNGQIKINSWEGDTVKLDAIKRSRFDREELEKVEIEVTEGDNEIKIEVKYLDPGDARVSVDMNIKVPDNIIVDYAKTSNGDIQISGTKGDTEASSSNGAIIIDGVDGYVKASTSNGGIDIKGTTGIDDLETSNGAINAEIFDFQKDVDIKTSNGGITVYINPSLDADIEMGTSNGKISVNDVTLALTSSEENYMKGTLGEGGDKLSIKTTNGNVNLNKLVA